MHRLEKNARPCTLEFVGVPGGFQLLTVSTRFVEYDTHVECRVPEQPCLFVLCQEETAHTKPAPVYSTRMTVRVYSS